MEPKMWGEAISKTGGGGGGAVLEHQQDLDLVSADYSCDDEHKSHVRVETNARRPALLPTNNPYVT